MRINLTIDVDCEESGLEEDSVKDNIVDFTVDLLLNGAVREEVELELIEVCY